jgi:hypothetical protein
MWLENIANYTRAANITGVGQSVYVYTLKENDVGAMFTSQTGGLAGNSYIPDYYKGPFQLIVRSNSAKDANDQATAISKMLSSHERIKLGLGTSISLPSILINYIFPRHLPVVYPRSDGGFFEASVNFDICFVAISA